MVVVRGRDAKHSFHALYGGLKNNASAVTVSAAQQIEQHKYSPEQHRDSMVSYKGKSRGLLEKIFADFTTTPFCSATRQVASKITR
jgi:hypothetical protein